MKKGLISTLLIGALMITMAGCQSKGGNPKDNGASKTVAAGVQGQVGAEGSKDRKAETSQSPEEKKTDTAQTPEEKKPDGVQGTTGKTNEPKVEPAQTNKTANNASEKETPANITPPVSTKNTPINKTAPQKPTTATTTTTTTTTTITTTPKTPNNEKASKANSSNTNSVIPKLPENYSVKYLDTVEQDILKYVNIERQKAGLQPVTLNSKLCEIARYKANEMLQYNYFEHVSPYTGSPWDLAKRFGYIYKRFGENIYMNYGFPESKITGEYIVQQWMASPGHRANILNCDFKQMGIGGVFSNKGSDGNEDFYTSQMFSN